MDDTMDLGAAPASRAPPALAAGTVLAERYTILSVLGEGGMGVVYAVYDAQLDRRVALKLLRAVGSRAGAREGDSAGAQARLLREAQAMARVNHPNVVSVYDVGRLADGEVFAALELVEGETLRLWLRHAKRSWQAMRDVLVDAGRGLAAVHLAGLVHRDFKPDNVLVGKDGRARLTDFGIVRQGDAADTSERVPLAPSRGQTWDTALTMAGSMPGTPRYMAPEIFEGKPADARSDLYSFCVAAYEAFFGWEPAAQAWLSRTKQGGAAPTPDAADVPAWLTRAVMSGLRPDPAARPASMDVLLAGLGHDGQKGRSRWLPFLASGAVAVSLIVAVAAAIHARQTERAQLCKGGEARLVGVWDATRETQVSEAFRATGKAYAPETWAHASRTLDAYARALVDMDRASCEATRLHGAQSESVMTLRSACLEERRQSLSALVDVLAHADSAVVEKAEQAAAALPSLRACEDVLSLTSGVPEPEGPLARTKVQDTRSLLAHAAPLRLAGKTEDAVALSSRALEQARAVGYAPLLADALLERGRDELEEAPAAATPLLTEAVWTAQAARQDRVAAAAAVALTQAGAARADARTVETFREYARAALQRIGGDDELEALLESALALADREQVNLEKALAHDQRAADLTTRRFGKDDVRTLDAQRQLLTGLTNVGRFEEARAKKRELVEREEALVGAKHPVVIRTRLSLAFSDLFLGYLDEAGSLLDLVKGTEGAFDSPSTRVVWNRYASELALQRGKYDESIAAAERALAVLREQSLEKSENAIELEANIGLAMARGGKAAATILRLNDALKAQAAKSQLVSPLLIALGEAYDAAGHAGEALAARERIVALVAADGSDDGSQAEAHEELQKSLVHVRPAESLAMNDKSHDPLLHTYGPRSATIAASFRLRGEALLALGRAAEAVAPLDASLAVLEAGGYDPNERARVRGLLARAHFADASKGADVQKLVAEAGRDYALAPLPNAAERAELLAWWSTHGVRRADAPR